MVLLLLGGFLYFALMADAFYNGGKDTIDSKETQIMPSLPLEVKPDTTNEISIHKPANGTRTNSSTVAVQGQAPANSTVAIFLNGTLHDSEVARNGQYKFPDVPLTKPTNVLQTRFYAENGTSASSHPIMVFHEENEPDPAAPPPFFENNHYTISRGSTGQKNVALTFDADHHSRSASSILKLLADTGIRATFFLTRNFIDDYPATTRTLAQHHDVGIYAFDHFHESAPRNAITKQALQNELLQTRELFRNQTGKEIIPVWRISPAMVSPEIFSWAAEIGFIHVSWTNDVSNNQQMDSYDWITDKAHPNFFPGVLIKERLLSFGQGETTGANGAIILMHLDSQRHGNDSLERWLPEIIATLTGRGYRFVTVGELLETRETQAGGDVRANVTSR